MAKRKRKEILERESLAAKFRWDFLMRNEKFLNELLKIFTLEFIDDLNKKLPENFNPKNQNDLEDLLKRVESVSSKLAPDEKTMDKYIKFFDDYGLLDYWTPHPQQNDDLEIKEKYDHLHFCLKNHIRTIAEFLFLMEKKEIIPAISLNDNPRLETFSSLHKKRLPKFKKPENIAVQINLNFPNDVILSYVEEILNEQKQQKKDVLEKKKPAKARKTDFKILEKCLEVYDLRKTGLAWRKIASKVYPDDDPDNALRKVILRYDRCIELINGDFKEIR